MKKLLKQIVYGFSLVALMALVFSGNIVAKLGKEEGGDQKNKNLAPESLFSAFGAQTAFADAPAPSDGGFGNSGCSADGAGSSACGASGGDA